MKNIIDYVKSKPRGWRIGWADRNDMPKYVIDNWIIKGNYYIHDGCVYKRVRRLKHVQ